MKLNFKQVDQRQLCGLILLCAIPLGMLCFTQCKQGRIITASAKTLAKYTGMVPLGGSGFVRLNSKGLIDGYDGSWRIFTQALPHSMEARSRDPRGWKSEFVEELPDWNGDKSIGVKVTAPKKPNLPQTKEGSTLQFYHERDGEMDSYEQPFQLVTPTPTSNPLDV